MIFKGVDLYVATYETSSNITTILKITPAGTTSVFAILDPNPTTLSLFPTDLAFDAAGNLYVAATNNSPGSYWRITPTGVVTQHASQTSRGPSSIDFDAAGNLYVTDAVADVILRNGQSFANARPEGLSVANGLLFDSSGRLFALGTAIFRVSATGKLSTVADVLAANTPTFTLDPTGDFLILNASGSPDLIARVTSSGTIQDICSLGFDDNGTATDLEFGPDGVLYLSDFPGGRILKVFTPALATEVLQSLVTSIGLPGNVEASLTTPLGQAMALLTDNNPNNEVAVCGKLDAFINQVDAKEKTGQLTPDEASTLREAAEAIKTALGCP
jgi:sugar lactone lactonase YvrE